MARKFIYLVSEDWYFLSHRLPKARAACDAGYEVHVATRVVDGGRQIQVEEFTLHPISWRRGSASPAAAITTVREVRRFTETCGQPSRTTWLYCSRPPVPLQALAFVLLGIKDVNLPLSFLEAAACGRPIPACDVQAATKRARA